VVGVDVLFFRPDETMIAITAPSLDGASSRRGRLAAKMPANVVV
jgi:hypothetical protein